MGTINGFAVVARKPVKVGHGYLILGMRMHNTAPSGFEYVVATIDSIQAHHWGQGFYVFDFDAAVDRFRELDN